jgi:hypothetical protein
MTHLRTEDHFAGRGDDVYELLVSAYRDLNPADGRALNARLVLLLANHIGDLDVIDEAIAAARATLASPISPHEELP